jgi:Bacterial capsule synthesis protein PGA_cap
MMELKKLLFTAASIVLSIQLVLLQPVVPLVAHSQGDFISALHKVSVVPQRFAQKAILASDTTNKYQSVVFVGDVMLGRNVEHLMRSEGSDYPYRGLDLTASHPQSAVVGNFESSMSTEHVETPAYAMRFSVAEMFLPALQKAHFTHLSLANNHSSDNGEVGYQNALTKLMEHGFLPFGNGEAFTKDSISYIDTEKGSVALIGINASQRIPSELEIEKVFLKASRRSSFQIVYIHWGNEYEIQHSDTQRLLAEILVNAGADLIVGHHPHVVQDIDLIKGVVVFYSLGNYIFDQYFSKEVQEGLVIGLDLQNSPSLILNPVSSVGNLSQPHIMEPTKQQNFLKALGDRSHPSLRDKIRSGSIPLLDTVATSTKVAMM